MSQSRVSTLNSSQEGVGVKLSRAKARAQGQGVVPHSMLASPASYPICLPLTLPQNLFPKIKNLNVGVKIMKQNSGKSSHIRFSNDEYLRMKSDQQLTGKRIPWLLKTSYFKKEITPPTLDPETRKIIRRELSSIGNNLNQLTRYLHIHPENDLTKEIQESLQTLKILKSYLEQDYGHR